MTQLAWYCRACGSATLIALGWCRRCYDRRRHSRLFFGGHREAVLIRDGCCQLCLAPEGLVVHHRRRLAQNRPADQIAVCRRCHARLHRRGQLPGVYSDLFFRLWREQHPHTPAQLRLPLAASP